MNCPNCGNPIKVTYENMPSNLRPLTAWAYFGYTLLFSIPLVGFVFLIVFSFSRANINRRSFARSYFCSYIIIAIAFGVIVALGLASGIGAEIAGLLS